MYYTPSLDEFHSGFVFEEKVNNEWAKKIFKQQTLFDILNTRVKYLDEDDILDLGFRRSANMDGNVLIFRKDLLSATSTRYVVMELTYIFNEPFVSLFDDQNEVILFEMNIKNVNELKWILNRYALVEDSIG